MVNDEYKFIFIHINKTGGSSIEKVFDYEDIKHERATQIRAKIGEEKWGEYFKFTIIRNPWERLVSEYFYRKKKGSVVSVPFREWMQMMYVYKDTTYSVGPQTRWYVDMDFVGRFECLQEDFDYVCNQIGHPQTQLPHINSTDHKHYSTYYDDEIRKLVEEWHQPELDNYHFEEI